MNRTRRALFAFFLILTLIFAGQTCKSDKKTEFEITKAASKSIQYLAGLGLRHAGTENEEKALKYIQKRLKKAGLKTDIKTIVHGKEKTPLSPGSLVC